MSRMRSFQIPSLFRLPNSFALIRVHQCSSVANSSAYSSTFRFFAACGCDCSYVSFRRLVLTCV